MAGWFSKTSRLSKCKGKKKIRHCRVRWLGRLSSGRGWRLTSNSYWNATKINNQRYEFISIPPSHLPFHIESSKALHYGYGGQIEGLKNPDVQFRGSEEGDDGEGDGEETMFQCSRVAVSSAPGRVLFLCTNRALPRASLGQRTSYSWGCRKSHFSWCSCLAGLQFILSADQKPYFLNFDREKAMRLLEAQKRKGK